MMNKILGFSGLEQEEIIIKNEQNIKNKLSAPDNFIFTVTEMTKTGSNIFASWLSNL
jgi:hypothetical protein